MRSLRYLAIPFLWSIALAAPAQVIRDEAHIFESETLLEARSNLAQIERTHGKQVLIETYPSLSRLRAEGVNLNEPAQVDAVFQQWGRDRCKAENLDGLYILICKDPKYVLVMVWPDSNEALVNAENRTRIHRILASGLGYENSRRERLRTMGLTKRTRPRADDSLLHALWVVDKKMEWHRPVDWSGWSGGLAGMVGLLCAWMVLGLVRHRLRAYAARTRIVAPEQFNAPTATPGAVLGGSMGTVVAQWLMNRQKEPPASTEPLTVTDQTHSTFGLSSSSFHSGYETR